MVIRKICLDTNAYTALVRGENDVVKTLQTAQQIYLPIVVLAELLYGFRLGTQESKNRMSLDKFLAISETEILQTTVETASIFADIKSSLKYKGRPIPTNDLWIAALAIEAGSVLMTFDKHFADIAGLRLWPRK